MEQQQQADFRTRIAPQPAPAAHLIAISLTPGGEHQPFPLLAQAPTEPHVAQTSHAWDPFSCKYMFSQCGDVCMH